MTAKTYTEEDHDQIASVLIGRRIVKAEMGRQEFKGERWTEYAEGVLTLDDGTRLYLEGNDGCACPSGNYDLEEVAEAPNIITSVSFEDAPTDDDDENYEDGHYSIYVWAENQKIRAAHFEGTDGNGYYGTGYRIHVVPPTTKEQA